LAKEREKNLMVAKKLLTTFFLIGFLFSWIAFIGCTTSPPNPEAQKSIDEHIRETREQDKFMKPGRTR
jgi:hypothetical protein